MDYLSQLWVWLLAVLLNGKTATLAATLLVLYAKRLTGEIPTNELLWVAVWAAILAWAGTSLFHGLGKRVRLLK